LRKLPPLDCAPAPFPSMMWAMPENQDMGNA
jgi:hypothetical protein